MLPQRGQAVTPEAAKWRETCLASQAFSSAIIWATSASVRLAGYGTESEHSTAGFE